MLSLISILLFVFIKEHSSLQKATFTEANSGVTGTVTIKDGTVSVDLTVVNKQKWHECQGATKVKYAITTTWDNGVKKDEGGEFCTLTQVGGNLDYWRACGPNSEYAATYCAANCLNIKDTDYSCSKTSPNFPFNCQIGDFSGIGGELTITGNKITGSFKSAWIPEDKELETSNPAQPNTRSITFRCVNPAAGKKPEIFCGKFELENENAARVPQDTSLANLTAKFSSMTGDNYFAFYKNGDIKFNMPGAALLTSPDNTPCPQNSEDTITVWKSKPNIAATYGGSDVCTNFIDKQYDPTSQCYGSWSEKNCDGKKLCGLNTEYNCQFQRFDCSPADISGLMERYAIQTDAQWFRSNNGKKEFPTRLIPSLETLKDKWLVWHCTKPDSNGKVFVRACAKLLPPKTTTTTDPDSVTIVSVFIVVVSMFLTIFVF